ncbi:MAG: RNA polymerase sigma factor [Proteobacteria bacterium]|nr:RNA polymerase sigma factor [Pseudomonadota bacterium]
MADQKKQAFMANVAESHGRQLRRFLSVRLRHAAADVPDLMQEIFLRLLRIKDHEAVRNPQAYLYTVANHVLHQHALQKSRRPETMDPLEMVAEPDIAADPAEELDIRDRIERVCRGLEAVSPRACATLLMYRCEGLTLEEIGQRLGVSRPMARKYLLRAMQYCDEHLDELE